MVTSQQIIDLLESNGIMLPNYRVKDPQYSLVSRQFIETDFASAFLTLLNSFELVVYKKNGNDCDKFAYLAWSFARALHGRMDIPTGLGMGVIEYTPDGYESTHEINFWVVDENNKLVLLFWEPQSRRFKLLSENEKNSICDITF